MYALAIIPGAVLAYYAYQHFGGKKLKDAYAPGKTWPAPMPGDWARYHGARPEYRGNPINTILAFPKIQTTTPEFRAALLDAAEELRIPVDSLAAIIYRESGFNSKAVFMHEGKPFAVGIIQLTKGANLEGFKATEKLAEVLGWSAEEQVDKVLVPYYQRMRRDFPWTPGDAYMRNFLPDDAGKPDGFILGDSKAEGWRKKVYDMNPGFDPGKAKGHFTVGDVKNSVAYSARQAGGKRITVEGEILSPPDARPPGQAGPVKAPSKTLKDVYELRDSAGGVLLACLRAGRVQEPKWARVRLADGLEVEVTTDAIMGQITVKWPELVTGYMRLPVTYTEQIEIARHFNAVSPTQEIWDASFDQAKHKIDVPPDEVKDLFSSKTPDGSIEQSALFSTLINSTGAFTELARDVGKGWILHPRLSERGAVNYGWINAATKKAVQSPGAVHGPSHFDYSQTCVLVKRKARRDGKDVDLLEELERRTGIERRFLDVYR